MKNLKISLSLVLLSFTGSVVSQTIHHNLNVKLSIADRSIEVVDSLTIPIEMAGNIEAFTFFLNKNLLPESLGKSYDIKKIQVKGAETIYNTYSLTIPEPGKVAWKVPIKYSGVITEEISTGADEYARGFSETSGIITDAGVYLAGSTYWIPTFEGDLVSFNLTVTLRNDWNVISQGTRIMNEVSGDTRIVKYYEGNPTEEVYLISANWTEYETKAGEVLVQAFLRTPDSALASRYLEATSGYLNLYVDLIGPYPYTKFALVENFWETGFGMPSFTLLGEKIIRFPWILTTSYPHELLHNWWGNSVYVDFEKGNWCEGLTAYMADHLLKEQAGQGVDYRRTTLQKYTDYVNVENDFPVMEFRSRNNSAEEAIGYGKCLMFNHMLRRAVGDEHFINAYREFYKSNIYQIATFDDILASFQDVSENDLNPFFETWLLRTGAPQLELADVGVEKRANGFELGFSLAQVQEEAPFFLNVPVAVYFEDRVDMVEVICSARTTGYVLNFPERPLKIEVDPLFDVFRRLDVAEVPPTLSQVFGSRDAYLILPQNSPYLEDYKTLAETWKATQEAQGNSLRVVMDDELPALPDQSSAWIIGFENKFAPVFTIQQDYKQAFDTAQAELIQTLYSEGSLVYAIPNPGNNAFTLGFVGTNVKMAVPGLARLLTHYGKYSFLGFEGERPNNVLKGNFPALNSPLFFSIPYDGVYMGTNAVLAPGKPLIE